MSQEIHSLKDDVCPLCGCSRILSQVPISDRTRYSTFDLQIITYDNPNDLLHRRMHNKYTLYAWICAGCGYTQLFLDKPTIFAEDYEQQHVAYDEQITPEGSSQRFLFIALAMGLLVFLTLLGGFLVMVLMK